MCPGQSVQVETVSYLNDDNVAMHLLPISGAIIHDNIIDITVTGLLAEEIYYSNISLLNQAGAVVGSTSVNFSKCIPYTSLSTFGARYHPWMNLVTGMQSSLLAICTIACVITKFSFVCHTHWNTFYLLTAMLSILYYVGVISFLLLTFVVNT